MVIGTAQIGETVVEVTRLGFGGAPLGGWPAAIDEATATATVDTAWDLGVRYFDTAPYYGYGQSERWLGAALRRHPRDEYVLSTKVGRLVRPAANGGPRFFDTGTTDDVITDYSADGARRSIDESLERLGVDRIDIALVHDPDGRLDEAVDGALRGLLALRDEGVVRAIGAGMNDAGALAYLARRADLDCILLAGRYTLLDQVGMEELLPLAVERGISIIAGGVFNSGVLAAPGTGAMFDYLPADRGVVERAVAIAEVCARHDVAVQAAALQFPLAHPAVATVVTGVRSPGEIRQNDAWSRVAIPVGLWDDLRAAGLLSHDAPTPCAPPARDATASSCGGFDGGGNRK